MKWMFSKDEAYPRQDVKPHLQKARAYIERKKPKSRPKGGSGTRYSVSGSRPEPEEARIRNYLRTVEKKPAFNATVLRLMAERHMTPKEFYTRAGLDRKLFSALKNGGPDYHPSRGRRRTGP